MIVKNEMANLKRCLDSVVGYVDCWVIGDTGSSDGTQDFIQSYFNERGIPGELHTFPFINFEQARNAALDAARASSLTYDYLLLTDSDMELVVEDRDFRSKLEAECYDLLQRSDISYWNPRVLRRDSTAVYRGVTHEYLEVRGGGKQLSGVWFKDHATGSNRVDKFERDIRLLSEGLKLEPNNARYWFYLAQSLRDAGRNAEAARAYAKRAEMGGWDEEAWCACLQEARCLRSLGDEGGFLRQAIAAFNQRPQRAEPLYDLARFYREKGMNDASVLFSEQAIGLPRPERDVLFIEDYVYSFGLKEEYSISAYFSRDPARKARGYAACNWIALNREAPSETRKLARSNLFFYLQSASEVMSSFATRQVEYTAPNGFAPSNPSITRRGDEIFMIQRTVNYVATSDGGFRTLDGSPVQTRNFLLNLTNNLSVLSAKEILLPADMPEPMFKDVLGFEDMRLFVWRGQLWCVSNVRELNQEGWCDQVLARINDDVPGLCRLTDWRVLCPQGPRQHEKNWMPQVVGGDRLQFIYLCDPTRIVDEQARTIAESVPEIAAEHFRGGSQAIAFFGGWLALIHEVQFRDQRRFYQHRFVWFDALNKLRQLSRPFYFQNKGLEFAAGLAWHLDQRRLLISYGAGEKTSWLASVDAAQVKELLQNLADRTE